jgi:hypothetical protein
MALKEFWYALGIKNNRPAILGPYFSLYEVEKAAVYHFGFQPNNDHRNYLLFCEYMRDIKEVTVKVKGVLDQIKCNP